MQVYYQKNWPPSQHATDTAHWLAQINDSRTDTATYTVSWEMEWEPYFAVARKDMPRYDTRFQGV